MKQTGTLSSPRAWIWLSLYCLLLIVGGVNILRVTGQNKRTEVPVVQTVAASAEDLRDAQRQRIQIERRLTALETKMDGLERLAWATLMGLGGLIITMIGRAAASVWATAHDRKQQPFKGDD